MGFTVVGKTRGYYREPREDAVVMRISQSNVKY
jgi:UDP-N-acetyl-D-mannosaminuronic acid transferase (WecB/TagA/CpsF family)